MSAGDIAVLVAAAASFATLIGLLVAVGSLRREVRIMRAASDEIRSRTVPLVADAHRVVDQAATEMERVGAVLDSTDSVHATVDSASRLAYRAFSNPVVKVLALRSGAAAGLRRLGSGPGPRSGNGASSVGSRRNGNGTR